MWFQSKKIAFRRGIVSSAPPFVPNTAEVLSYLKNRYGQQNSSSKVGVISSNPREILPAEIRNLLQNFEFVNPLFFQKTADRISAAEWNNNRVNEITSDQTVLGGLSV